MRVPALLVVPAFVGAIMLALIPAWQMPDEPAHFEYAALWARLGSMPQADSYDAELDRLIGASLARQHFYRYLLPAPPQPLPTTLSDARKLFFMPSQLGNDPPLAYAPAALLMRILAAEPVETQLYAMRSISLIYTLAAVLCIYAAALQLTADRHIALASGLLAGLHPQFLFVGVTASNDALANLLGAGVCLCLVAGFRVQDSGFSRPLLFVALLTLLLAGLATKRGFVPIAVAMLVIGAIWACQQVLGLRREPRTKNQELSTQHRAPRAVRVQGAVVGLLFGAVFIVVLPAFATPANPAVATAWHGPPSGASVVRIERSAYGKPALLLPTGSSAEQHVSSVISEWAQGDVVRFSARVWSESPAQGRLLIDYGWDQRSLTFYAGPEPQLVAIETLLPLYAPQLRVLLFSDAGAIFADDLRATSIRQPDLNLLKNGDLRQTASIQQGGLLRIDRYLPLHELQWAWQSGRFLGPMPAGPDTPRVLFASFWGQFGWMSLPLVGGTYWELLLIGVCLGGLLGTMRYLSLSATAAWQRRAVLALLTCIALGIAAPLANSYLQPRAEALPQGRYLFPAFAPIALLLTLGWHSLLPPRLRSTGFLLSIALWGGLTINALWLLAQAY